MKVIAVIMIVMDMMIGIVVIRTGKNIKIIVTGNVIEAIGTGVVIVNRYLPFIKKDPFKESFFIWALNISRS